MKWRPFVACSCDLLTMSGHGTELERKGDLLRFFNHPLKGDIRKPGLGFWITATNVRMVASKPHLREVLRIGRATPFYAVEIFAGFVDCVCRASSSNVFR